MVEALEALLVMALAVEAVVWTCGSEIGPTCLGYSGLETGSSATLSNPRFANLED